jgi:hypothetical protein
LPQALRPHGEWVGISINIISAAYNTNLVRPSEVPKSYNDLKDPRWKGRLAIEADDVDWFAAVVGKLGEAARPAAVPRHRCAPNGVSTRTGHKRSCPTWWRRARYRSHSRSYSYKARPAGARGRDRSARSILHP